MNYHNPEQITEWGQSDGWRLLTTEEIKQPLPDDAEFYSALARTWLPSNYRGAIFPRYSEFTLRTKKPLPVSPLIAQLDAEIKAKQELKEIALAVEAGAEWEHVGGGAWYTPEDQSLEQLRNIMSYGYEVRLKPKPVTRDWNKPEDVPGLGPCYLRRKDGRSDDGWTMIIAANIHGVVIATGYLHDLTAAALKRVPWESLKDVLHSTDRINWKPCNCCVKTKEEAK